MASKVFISYSHADSAFADRLAEDLRYSHVAASYDRWILRPGDSYFEKLASSVSDCDAVVVVLSPNSVTSQWVSAELGLAMATRFGGKRVAVLPALIADCQLPPALADKHFADFRHGYFSGLRDLLKGIDPAFDSEICDTYLKKEVIETDRAELRSLIETAAPAEIASWMARHKYVIPAVFGGPW